MDIKLRARLSAYSKVESVTDSSSVFPDPEVTASGHIVGVNDVGKYTLFPQVNQSDIDELFDNTDSTTAVTKEEIDTLFDEDKNPVVYPTTEPSIQTVTNKDIDSLFEEV